jgi:hypothetical protein
MEDIMKTIFQLTTASILAASFFSIVTPATATEAGEAMRLCRKNPNCNIGEIDSKGNLTMSVDDGDKGKIITCPIKGPCKSTGIVSNGQGNGHDRSTGNSGTKASSDNGNGGGGLPSGDGTGAPQTGANGGGGGGVIQ